MTKNNEINEKQMEAIKHDKGPVLVLAGAGSGKTKVLTHRIANLIGEHQVHPEQILALTFTNKAAQEMKDRVYQLVETSPPTWVSTFHSACVRILRREIESLGYHKDFLIYDTKDKLALIKECLQELNLDEKLYQPNRVGVRISGAKNELKNPRDLAAQGGFYEQTIKEIYQLYEQKLKRQNALDFDDLLKQTVALLQYDPQKLAYYQQKFRYVLVDEFQDTNPAQYALISLLAPPDNNVFAVGDDDQSIYLFRGADVRNILNFEQDYPKTKVIKLEQNYRSTHNILSVANDIVTKNSKRKSKELWTTNTSGEQVKFYCSENEYDEAKFIAHQVRNNEYNFSLMAVLYRTNAQARAIEEVFKREGISYNIIGGQSFYDRKEIKDILAYLNVIQVPEADTQLIRIINEPRRGIGKQTQEKVQAYAEEQNLSLYQALLEVDYINVSNKAKKNMKEFIDLLSNFRKMREYLTVTELIEQVAEQSGYLPKLEEVGNKEARDRIDNIKELYSMAKDFEYQGGTTLQEFLTYHSLLGDIDTWEEENQAQVVMMTLHSAKGLEFPCVFLTGMEEDLFPHFRSRDNEEELEEERRICYVGITRAEELLFLTRAKERTIYGRTNSTFSSRFLEEINPEKLEDVSVDADIDTSVSWNSSLNNMPHQTKNFATKDFTQNNSSKAQDSVPKFNQGDLIEHKKWGQGEVIEVEEARGDFVLTVKFQQKGVKRLAASIAPVKRL